MISSKTIARIVGALFIITMIAGMIDANIMAPVLSHPLDSSAQNTLRMKAGAFFIMVMAIGISGISVVIYPVIKKQSEIIAITYVSFRAVECVLLLAGPIVYFFLISFSQAISNAGRADTQIFQIIAASAIKIRYAAFQIAMTILGIGSTFLCSLLFKSRLIPRWISAVGITGYILLFVSALLDLFGIIDTVHGWGSALYIPGGIFELILFPAWLILKGFNLPARPSV